MRRFILSILLAGAAATPALAQDHGRWQQEEAKGDRQDAREARQQQHEQAREQRSGGTDVAPPQQQPQQAQPDRTPRFEMQQNAGGGSDGRRFEQHNNVQADVQAPQPEPQRQFDGRRRFEDRANVQAEAPQQPEPQRQGDGRDRSGWTRDRSNWNGNGDAQSGTGNAGWTHRSGDLRQSDRQVPNVMRDRNPLIVSQTPREGTQPPLRTGSRHYSWNNRSENWSGNWRNDRRYDWHGWRNRHRSTFRVGIYYDPFGWNYRPYQIGWRLWPSYYSRNNWINDPWQYRLPYAPPGTVWVRYWDDALLVDTYTGEVIDVIRDFFW